MVKYSDLATTDSLSLIISFPSKEGPQYHKGTIVNLAFQVLGLVLVLIMSAYYRYENRRRDRVEGGRPPTGQPLEVQEKFDFAPGRLHLLDVIWTMLNTLF